MKYGEFFREMTRVYEVRRQDKEFRRLQRYGKLKPQERFDSEEGFLDFLYILEERRYRSWAVS